jgi:chromosome segregation ATPase
MTTAMSARNQSIYLSIISLTGAASEIESIPTHFNRVTANIDEAIADVQRQMTELSKIRNALVSDFETLQSKTKEIEQSQSQNANGLEGSVEEAASLTDEIRILTGQLSSEKVTTDTFSRDLANLTVQRNQLQPKFDDTCRGLEAETTELSDLKRAKKDAKRDKAVHKKRIESTVSALLSAIAESERLKDTVSSLRKVHAAQQTKWQSIANDLRVRESAAVQQKFVSLQDALEGCQTKLRFSLQSQAQLKKRITDRQSQPSSRIHDGLRAQLQQVRAEEVRFKLENQGLHRRKADTDRTFVERQAEFSRAMEELNHQKTLTMERRSDLSTRMGDLQRTLAQDDDEIRRLTLAVNDLTVSVELAKNRQAAAKKLKQHIRKTEAEMESITQDSQSAKVRYTKPSAQLGNTSKRRILKLD